MLIIQSAVAVDDLTWNVDDLYFYNTGPAASETARPGSRGRREKRSQMDSV
jgi:hypothetical protein